MLKVLDCTLRDGGYYTDWDFEKKIVDEYIGAANCLPIDYLELGYRNNPSKIYLGKYGYCPVFELEDIRKKSTKKLSIMLNEKEVQPSDLNRLVDPLKGLIDMVRIAVNPDNFDSAFTLAEDIKNRGFEVGFNAMYMSKWKDNDDFLSKLHLLSSVVDVFCMVDSYGGVFPEEVKNTICLLISKTTCKIGFHGHNNLEMGLVNTIAAIEHGAEYVDATVLGMGRGAGNLKTELLLTYLNKNHNLEVDFNKLGDIITAFSGLLKKYSWGTNLPYMISGANSFPQKEVMDWISNRLYSFDNVVRALNNKKGNIVDNAKYPLFESVKFDKVIIIGGGSNAVFHIDGIKAFIKQQKSIALVHATVRYADEFKDVEVPQFFCAATSEGKRLTKVFNKKSFKGKYILPPYPRKMGTDVPELANNSTFELPSIDFTKSYWDSCTTIALQTALFLCDNDIYTIGYDGYPGNVLSEKEMALSNENKTLFLDFKKFRGKTLVSLTPTLYNELFSISLYQYI